MSSSVSTRAGYPCSNVIGPPPVPRTPMPVLIVEAVSMIDRLDIKSCPHIVLYRARDIDVSFSELALLMS